MRFDVPRHDETHRGFYFHDRYALRVTQRCLVDDLGEDATASFTEIRDREIVKAFIKDRATDPDGGKTVGSNAGDLTLRRVGYGDDHRGVTWWDREHGVVWLCAYHGKHRSGEADDSFRYFEQLLQAKQMYPTADDYEQLSDDEEAYFFDYAVEDAQVSLDFARQHQDEEIEVVIGRQVGTSLAVEVVETMEETYVVFSWEEVEHLDTPLVLLKAFYPDSTWDDWDDKKPFPARELRPGEVCFSHFHG